MLTICNRSRTPWAAAHYGIVAKVNRFSESTRKNRHNFPKYMGYRTKHVVYATYRHVQGIKVDNTLAMAILYLAKVF